MRTVKESNSAISNNYEENSLRAEVLKYKEKYDNKYKELEKAEKELEKQRQNATQNNSDLESKEEEIKQGNKILGLSEVTGPGVTVTLSDSKKDISSALDPSSLVVHDLDVLSVINELQNAGAEAISINGQRIINMSDIVDVGSNSIIFVNQQRILAPYEIRAIGDSTKLESTLLGNGGYVEELKNYGFDIDITKGKVSIPKYSKDITHKYIQ